MSHHLQMIGIEKEFSHVPVLKNVEVEIKGGEIHALLGANGAGKSTLIKILSGAYTLDRGEIRINHQPVSISSPQDAKRLGIHTVYQEVDTALIPTLTVAENIFIDEYARTHASFFVSWKKLYQQAEELLRQVGANFSVKKNVADLTLSEKQLVLIARAIAQEAKFVIFDEPTAPLSVTESEHLYRIMRNLKDAGVGVIFITHRLAEVFELSDRITVLRDGELISNCSTVETTLDTVIETMLGKALQEEFPKVKTTIGRKLFEVKGLVDHGGKVNHVHLHVSEGEIVGIFGLVGAGKTETARLLFGAEQPVQGEMIIHRQDQALSVYWRQPADAIKQGIVLVPEERRKEGIIAQESVKRNITLATLDKWSTFGFIQQVKERSLAKRIVSDLGIKSRSIDQEIQNLSGGNQQKVVVGKWLLDDALVYMFDEPTKGIDIGAKKDMYQLIGSLAQKGKGILYFTCEHAEILGIADRILVMYEGQIVKELLRHEANQEQLMYYASGGQERGNNQEKQQVATL